MPAYIKKLVGHQLQAVTYQAASLTDAVQYEPSDGIYTVANTFNTYDTIKLDAHFDRMEDSAARQHFVLRLNRQRIRQALRQMINEAQFGDVRFRVTVSRAQPDVVILSMEPYTPPSDALTQQGVRCITAPNRARHNAAAKTTDWMFARQQLMDAMPTDIYDTFLLDAENHILEGLGANVYVIMDDTLYTAADSILKGISRQIILEIAPTLLTVKEKAPSVAEISRFDEAFLTSSSRGIIPVIEIDATAIGNGTVGKYTRRLQAAYHDWVQTHLIPL